MGLSEDRSMRMAASRRQLLRAAVVVAISAPVLQDAALAAQLATPASAAAAQENVPQQQGSGGMAMYKGPISLGYVFEYPVGWSVTKKVIKTHLSEIQVISNVDSKLYAGLVVDPVKINSVKEFGTPETLGQKVVDLERKKDGVTSVNLLSASQKNIGDLDYYYIDYDLASGRGNKRFLAVATITGKQLFVLTAQCLSDSFANNESTMRAIVDSLKVKRQYFDAVY